MRSAVLGWARHLLYLELLGKLGGQLLADKLLSGQGCQPGWLGPDCALIHIAGNIEGQPAHAVNVKLSASTVRVVQALGVHSTLSTTL